MPDGHDVFVHRPSLDELHSNSILMSASPYPHIGTLQRERGRRVGRRPTSHKSAESHVSNLKGHTEDKRLEQSPGATSGEEKEVEAKGDMGEECATSKAHHQAKIDSELTAGKQEELQRWETGLRKSCVNSQDGSDVANSGGNDKTCPASVRLSRRSSWIPPLVERSLACLTCSQSLEMVSFHLVDQISFLMGMKVRRYKEMEQYAQTFKDHMIDGETLPLLSEEHLLDTLGLKLGPALKIRSQVSRRVGNMLYMMNLPLSSSALQATPEKAADRSSEIGSPVNCNSDEMLASPRDPEVLKSTDHLHETENNSPPSASSETA
ncbi:hypothetical protein KUCAC02_019035 [Chaenocephalus aceratus]|uniref:Uncharacterized protein n=1 Tax=Chaenocephalus aceratus TaxID=36190 RepID=A0ACB9WAJ7_CHAAC|nr:hypothetical protein KUCAC02_019035 [Chaenocephalus aceratus]